MTSQKYLNGVLTVIAFCLVILTLSVVGVFPKANAQGTQLNTGQKVDIVSVAGQPIHAITDGMATSHGGSLPIRK